MLQEKIIDLFEKYRDSFEGKAVAYDGLVNEAEYLASEIKTVFLLKEVNYPNMTEDWTDFLDSLNKMASCENEKLYKTWPNVCLWLEVLYDTDCSYRDCLNEYGHFDENRLKKNLKKTGIVNLKKTGGSGGSKWQEIMKATKKWKDLVVSQLEILEPNLVICGGTFYNARTLFDIGQQQVKMLPCGACYFTSGNTVYLEFVHPMWYSVNRNILFAYAKSVFTDLKKQMDEK